MCSPPTAASSLDEPPVGLDPMAEKRRAKLNAGEDTRNDFARNA
jgi:hypothetical protein